MTQEGQSKGYGFGTFKGVFMPSILTIFGVVMYLRFGWVLGNVGLHSTLIIVTLAMSITFLTGLSLSALATNMKVGGGGAYYIISRSLGLEPGAAVGLPLYCAQALGITFYIVGFSESVVSKLQEWEKAISGFPPIIEWLSYSGLSTEATIGLITLIAITILAYISANLTLYAQIPIFIVIFASLGVFFCGTYQPGAVPPAFLGKGLGFWPVFAVFFPAVTGIEAGIAMSGDLKDPAKSLPLGTLGAVLLSYVVYMAIPVFLYFKIESRTELIENQLIMADVAGRWGWVVIAAIWGASLSSAMGALLGAPRTLQALSKDRVLPQFIGKGYGPGNDPRRATVITLVIAIVGILAGNLNLIAPVLTMFFLTSYCLLNLSAAFEGWLASPSWRPKFRVHWVVSLIGGLLCVGVMIKIDFFATIGAGIVSFIVYYIMQRRSIQARWGDVRYGLMMLITKHLIYRMGRRTADERTWRPNLLVLSGAPTSRWYLIHLADAISQDKGFLTVAAIINEQQSEDRLLELRDSIAGYLEKQNVSAMVKLYQSEDVMSGAKELVSTYGFGPLVPNTVLMGETEKEENFVDYASLIDKLYCSKRNAVIVREGKASPIHNPNPIIDIWWRGQTNNAAFKLAVAFLLKKSSSWSRARVRLRMFVDSAETQADQLNYLQEFIKNSRLDAEAEVLVSAGKDIFESIRNASKETDLVFIGMRPRQEDETIESYGDYYGDLLKKTADMPPIIQVLAAEDVEFQRIFK